MKTIEEINEIAPYHPCEWQQGYGIWQSGYMEGQKNGATEQKTIDDKECMTMVDAAVREARKVFLDRACEWLDSNITCMDDETRAFFLMRFKKAMEG